MSVFVWTFEKWIVNNTLQKSLELLTYTISTVPFWSWITEVLAFVVADHYAPFLVTEAIH